MKRTHFLIAALMVAAAASAAVYYLRPSAREAVFSDLLPEDTLLAAEYRDLDGQISALRKSRLGRKISEIDAAGLAEQLSGDPNLSRKIRETLAAARVILDSRAFRALFSGEAALALIPPRPDAGPDPVGKLLSGAVLIVRPRYPVELIDFFTLLFSKKLSVTSESEDGFTINRFEAEPGLPIYYASIDRFVVAAFDRKTLVAALFRSRNGEAALTGNPIFRRLKDDLVSGETAQFSFARPENLVETVAALLEPDIPSAGLEPLFSRIRMISAGASAVSKASPDLFQTRTVLISGKNGFDDAASSSANKTLSLVPRGVLAYFWTNRFDAADLLAKLPQDRAVRGSEEFGMFMNAFGSQAALVLSAIETGGFLPIPKLTLLLETADRDLAERFVHSLAQRAGLRISAETHQGSRILRAPIPFLKDVEPSAAFLEGFCAISAHGSMIREMIETLRTGGGLSADPDFRTVGRGLSSANNTVGYIEAERLLTGIEGLIRWIRTILPLRDREMARKAEPFWNGAVLPLIDGLKMFRSIGHRSFLSGDRFESETLYRIENESNR